MRRIIMIPMIILNLTACNESDQAAKSIADGLPSLPIDTVTPTPTPPTITQGACSGDYLVGTWVHTPSAHDQSVGYLPQTYTINEDCTATNDMCNFDFEVPPYGQTSGYASGFGWSGSYNLRVRHLTAPDTTAPGCLQFQQVSTPWHDCNLFAVDNNTLEFQCNGPAGYSNGNGAIEPGRVIFIRQ